MPISIVVGRPGAGKSYHSVKEFILGPITPQLIAQDAPHLVESWVPGRNVVTSIDGLKAAKCREYVAETSGAPLEVVGQIKVLSYDEFLNPVGVFPAEKTAVLDENGVQKVDEDGEPLFIVNDANTVVKGGDLVVMDEAHRLIDFVDEKGKKGLPKSFRIFISEHRHYVSSSTGQTCALVFVTQALRDLHPQIKSRADLTYELTKQSNIGLNNVYMCRVFEGADTRYTPLRQGPMKYNPDIFGLYHSHNAAVTVSEKNLDKNTNVMTSPFMLTVYVFALGTLGFAGWLGYSTLTNFGSTVKSEKPSTSSFSQTPSGPQPVFSQTQNGQAAVQTPSSTLTNSTFSQASGASTPWRIIGTLIIGDKRTVLLSNSSGEIRKVRGEDFIWDGEEPVSGLVDGKPVSTSSGSAPVPPSVMPTALMPPIPNPGQNGSIAPQTAAPAAPTSLLQTR
jgi:zona occludens toxin (predicted ATPase)